MCSPEDQPVRSFVYTLSDLARATVPSYTLYERNVTPSMLTTHNSGDTPDPYAHGLFPLAISASRSRFQSVFTPMSLPKAHTQPSAASPPETASDEHDRHIRITLHRDGLGIHLPVPTQSWLLKFDDLTFAPTSSVSEPPQAHVLAIGVIGSLKLGPGYLVLIQNHSTVFHRHSTDIHAITKATVIPLKYELAKLCFKLPKEDISSRSSADDDTTSTSRDGSGASSTTELSTQPQNLAAQFTKQKDMLFSKLGVYANDFKSNASLSLSNLRASKISYDDFDNPTDSDERIDVSSRSLSSINLNRSITIKGLPTESKENKLMSVFEAAKVRRYESLGLDCNISSKMLCKFERQLERFYSSGNFFYSTSIDLTKHFQFENEELTSTTDHEPNSFLFNAHITQDIPPLLRIPIIQGFVNSIPLSLKHYDETKQGTVLLISKRSTGRAGSRYLRRGIDDSGNVANFVFTSQILIVDDFIPGQSLFTKFDILRGSIPVFFQQDPSKLKPVPYLTRPVEKCKEPFKLHFERLKESYGDVACISLVERSKKESVVGVAYEKLCQEHGLAFDWFDFHDVCKKMQFDNVVQLLDEKLTNSGEETTIERFLTDCGWHDSLCEKTQTGLFRVNCIDCLDRTNLVQKFMSEFILERYILQKYELGPPLEFKKSYNNLWADNGDYISRQYSSTNALKGDYTRTGKRIYAGMINDAFLTLSRYYSGYISDYFKQCFIDYVLGHQPDDIFESFESTLNVLDPNEIKENLNMKNSVLQTIIGELKFDDDLILIGSWSGFGSPLEYNILRPKKGALEDVSLFVTSKKLFLVDFNSKSSVITKTIVIDISDIKHLEYGTYILSTHNSLSSNPKRNIGLKIFVDKDQEPPISSASSPSSNRDSMHSVETSYDFLTLKFPQDMDYNKVKYIINLISKTCHSSTLENKDLMTSTEATTNVIDVLEHRFKKMVWG